MNKIKIIMLASLLIPAILFGYSNHQAKIIDNMVQKQEEIVTLVEDYLLSGIDVDLSSVGNKYNINREKLGNHYNINKNFFRNISNEECTASGTVCTNIGGLEFSMVEKNNKYIGVQFDLDDVKGSNCTWCNSATFTTSSGDVKNIRSPFDNLYKNIIIGDRIKLVNATSVIYPLRRTILDLFTKVDIYKSIYKNSLHIGSNPPTNFNKVWVDVRGSRAIERFWYNDVKQWLEKTTSNRQVYVKAKSDLLKLPKINGSKIKVLSDEGLSTIYSYNDVYATSTGCVGKSFGDIDYDKYCGWIKVITGMDDYDFIINGIQLGNQ